MKYLLFILIVAIGGTVSQPRASEEQTQKKVKTQCLTKDSPEMKGKKEYLMHKGVCKPRVNDQGYVCVKKRLFEKSNCVGTKILEEQ